MRCSLNKADVDIIVEIQRSRVLGRNEKKLRAILAEDEGLRGRRNVESPKKRRKIAELFVEFEFGLARVDPPLEIGDGFRKRSGVLLRGWFLWARSSHVQDGKTEHRQ
jgi:hypothetical protein